MAAAAPLDATLRFIGCLLRELEDSSGLQTHEIQTSKTEQLLLRHLSKSTYCRGQVRTAADLMISNWISIAQKLVFIDLG